MGIILKPEDIEPFADIPKDKLEAMIADVEAVAVSVIDWWCFHRYIMTKELFNNNKIIIFLSFSLH